MTKRCACGREMSRSDRHLNCQCCRVAGSYRKMCKCGNPVTAIRAKWCDPCRLSKREYHKLMPERPCRTEGCGTILPPGKARFCAPCRVIRQGKHAKRVNQHQRRTGLVDHEHDFTDAQIEARFLRAQQQRRRDDWLARQAARKGFAA